MATVSSSSSSNYASTYGSLANNKGIGGLLSGLDTDSLVEALTQGTRSKIAKQGQQKQLLQWKMEAYQSASTSLKAFNDTYFSYASSSVIKSNEYFRAWKAAISGSGSDSIVFNSNGTKTTGKVEIDEVTSLATVKTMKTNAGAYQDPLVGTKNSAQIGGGSFTGETLRLNINGTTRTIRLDSLNGVAGNNTAMKTALDALLADAFGAGIATADFSGGNLEIKAGTSTAKIMADCDVLGLTAGQSNRLDTSQSLSTLFPGLQGNEFVIRVNDAIIRANKDESLDTLMSRIRNSTGSGVSVYFDDVTEEFIFSAKSSGAGNTIDIEDVMGNLMNTWIGARGGTAVYSADKGLSYNYEDVILGGTNMFSPPVLPNTTVDEEFVSQLRALGTGDLKFNITVNGVTKTISVNTDFATWDYESDGVTLITDPAVIASNARNGLNNVIDQAIRDAYASEVDLYGNAITFPSGVKIMGFDGNYSAAINIADSDMKVQINTATLGGTDRDLLGFMGFISTDKNYGNADVLVSSVPTSGDPYPALIDPSKVQITIGGVPFDLYYDSTMTIEDLIDNLNWDYNTAAGNTPGNFKQIAYLENGRLVIDAGTETLSFDETGVGYYGNFMSQLFGVSTYTTSGSTIPANTGSSTKVDVVSGTNAEIILEDGSTITQASNDFTVNNISFKITEVVAAGAGIVIDVSSDSDSIIENIQAFIDDYNTLIDMLNSLVTEQVEKDTGTNTGKSRKYEPLTDEQREEMSEEEIKQWEEKAKKGIVYNDATLRRIISQMRETLYKEVSSVGLSIYNIGITTMSLYSSNASSIDYTNSGKLTIDEDKLKAAIERDPEAVANLFTDATDGIAVRMEKVIDDAIRIDNDKPGSLYFLAGNANNSTSASLTKKIAEIDKNIATLKLRLEMEYNRYWKQFTALETALQRLNTQMSWLDDFGA